MSITLVSITPKSELTDCLVFMQCEGDSSLHELENWCKTRCINNRRRVIHEHEQSYVVTVYLKNDRHEHMFREHWLAQP